MPVCSFCGVSGSIIFPDCLGFIAFDFLAVLFIMVDSHSVVRHFVGGSKFGLHFFFENFLVVLEKLFEDVVDEVPDAAWRPVS